MMINSDQNIGLRYINERDFNNIDRNNYDIVAIPKFNHMEGFPFPFQTQMN